MSVLSVLSNFAQASLTQNPAFDPKTFLPFSVLAASLAGSLHCTAMCGPLILSTCPTFPLFWAYQFGRLAGYLLLGATAGLLGESFLHASTLFFAGFCFWMGWKLWKKETLHLRMPRWAGHRIGKIIHRIWTKAEKTRVQYPAPGTGILGFLSVLLPCGWLHVFVVAAISTGSPWRGSALLFFFWLGTIPALLTAPTLIRKALGRISGPISGTLFIIIGIITVYARVQPVLNDRFFSETKIAADKTQPETCPFHRH